MHGHGRLHGNDQELQYRELPKQPEGGLRHELVQPAEAQTIPAGLVISLNALRVVHFNNTNCR